ncbi:MAG: glycoside hydrolase family 3 C-terminal domain-containing protein, partial [Bacillota bacterium]
PKTHRYTMKNREEFVNNMIAKMNTYQKVSQLINTSKRIKKLDIKTYDWWNEALHGVGRAGVATVFPQAIGLAAMFDEETMQKVADVVSTEGRAIYNRAQSEGDYSRYKGLTYWTPNINIFRDPRWGRGQETYGEDPYLTSRLGVAYIKGLQGDHPEYLKSSACAKHYAVHSGPEKDRHIDNIVPSRYDLFDTYLPAFEVAVKEGNVESVMSAYNAVDGVPCVCSPYLLQEVLRDNWGFKGHVVSDCGAMKDIWHWHKYETNPVKGVALALKAGCDLECGPYYPMLYPAVKMGYVKKADLDKSVKRLLTTRVKLGMFDNDCPYNSIKPDVIACKKHEDFAIDIAKRTVVLLKNDGLLPLKKDIKVAVVGNNANDERMLLGNYEGTPSGYITVLQGIKNLVGEENVIYARGSRAMTFVDHENLVSEAVSAANNADVVVLCTGIDATIEGEESGDRFNEEIAGSRGDRDSIQLPKPQVELIDAIVATGKPVVMLNFSGSAIAFSGREKNVSAVMQCWYPGGKGGQGVAEVLFGDYNPSAKMPVTFYRDDKDIGNFKDYSMANRTYRYFGGTALYPFGFGLSYTTFTYSNIALENGVLSADVTNTGSVCGSEVAELYITLQEPHKHHAKYALKGCKNITLNVGETTKVSFAITKEAISYIEEDGSKSVAEHMFTAYIGGCSPDKLNAKLGATLPLFLHIDPTKL